MGCSGAASRVAVPAARVRVPARSRRSAPVCPVLSHACERARPCAPVRSHPSPRGPWRSLRRPRVPLPVRSHGWRGMPAAPRKPWEASFESITEAGICLHHPAFLLASIPVPSRPHLGVRGPQPGVGGPEPYEGRGTSWPSGAAPAPRSQLSRSQQPWGRSYPTRLPAPAAFPTSPEQLQLFLPSPSQESFLRGHLHHFGGFAQGTVTPFQRKEGEKQPKPEARQSCYQTPFPGGSSPAGPTMNLSGIPVKSPDRDMIHFRIWTQ